MMKQGLVSIIMPAYNSEKYIVESIESVISQTYKNWELIVVNDCSKDKTLEIIKKFSEKNDKIKIFNNEENKGVVFSRNLALKQSKGQYIAFLDSDDLWLEKKLEKQLELMKKEKCSFSITGYMQIDENGRDINCIKAPLKLEYKEALKGNKIGCLTVLINKEEIGFFEMPNMKHEDYATWLKIMKKGYNVCGLDEPLAKYRKGSHTLSSNKLKVIFWTWPIYRKELGINCIMSLYYLIQHLIRGMKKHFIYIQD